MMNGIINVIKMDMAICRKSMIIMMVSMLAAGTFCLFFLTPMLLGFFVVGSTAVVSAIFMVESKSNMEIFYGCFPIKKWEHIIGRSLTGFFMIAITGIISIIFTQIEIRYSLCRIEEVKIITETMESYQMLIVCAMITVGFIGEANLLIASFAGKIESREILEVILLLLEALLVGIIMFIIQKIFYNGDMQDLLNLLNQYVINHKGTSCILLIAIGLTVLIAGTIISLNIVQRKRI